MRHQATQIFLRPRLARSDHVRLHRERGWREPVAPAYAGGTRAISPGECPLPGGPRRLRRRPLHLGPGAPTAVRTRAFPSSWAAPSL